MNKAELIKSIEQALGSRKAATEALDAVLDAIVREVSKGGKVAITGFGTFEKAARAARTGRNPRTGEAVRIPQTSVPRFKPASSFKSYVADPTSLPKAAPAVARAAVGTATVVVESAARLAGLPTRAAPAKGSASPSEDEGSASPRKSAAKKSAAKKSSSGGGAATKSTAKKSAAKKSSSGGGASKKSAAKKSSSGGGASKKSAAKKSSSGGGAAKKSAAKKSTAKKSSSGGGAAKKSSAKKSTAKKSPAKKSTAKKSTAKKSGS
ncbi:hypothetical protein GCM10022199_24910 [Marihabitans asiaticum]|uniref:HU family DNA-binding protein n=1 Tax=Marihabitans asiaticum TaxID=415218 RepID=UPI0011A44D27|nr:HU family DNA-binding protein [Marihabitans asiaticum]